MPFIKSGDLNTYYIDKGEGEPVVFVHGNWTTSTSWLPVLDIMPHTWRAIAYDVRGRGKTEGPDNDYTMPELAADLRNLADALELDKFHLVGHSLGSAIAMQFGMDNRERLKTLTAVAPAWVDGLPEVVNQPDAQRVLAANKEIYRQALRMMMPTMKDEALYDRLVDEGHKQRLEATMRNVDALMQWKPGNSVGEIGVPTLVVVGDQDQLTGPNAARTAQALKAEVVTMPGVGHSPNIEAPEAFLRILLTHIGRVRSEA